MKVGIMQPYFMPYIGYWQLIKAVDKYVIYDDVNYIKGGWINRNNILVNGNKKLFSISLNEASQNKLINKISISDDFVKFRKTIAMAYSKAPYYDEIINLIDKIIDFPKENLASFIGNSISLICNHLSIKTVLLMSSSIEKDNTLKAQNKILEICSILNANQYINAIGGQDLYDKGTFQDKGIQLNFLRPEEIKYKQFRNPFVPNLSMIDVLMFNSADEINVMLDRYTLI